MRIKRFNESISEEDMNRINEIGDDMWGIKFPVIGLSKSDIRKVVVEAFLPPPGGFNKNIFGTARSIKATKNEVIALVEIMNLKKIENKAFASIAEKLSNISKLKVEFRAKMTDGKIFVEFKFQA